MNVWSKLMRIILEGQAYLYADMNRMRWEAKGQVVTDDMFNAWRDDWMKDTNKLLSEVDRAAEDY